MSEENVETLRLAHANTDSTPPSRPSVKVSVNHTTRKVKVKFRATDNDGVAGYMCRFDSKPYRSCVSPKRKKLRGQDQEVQRLGPKTG